jgi:integrase
MPAQSITDTFCRNVKPPRKDDKPNQATYTDTLERGLALVLIVSYGGSKTFRVLTYTNGKPHSRKLGTYPAMTVKKARAKAREYWQNPEKFEAQAQPDSFKEVAEQWLKRHVEKKALRSRPEIERCLNVYVFPKWKNRRFLEIRRAEVNVLLDGIEDANGARQADVVLSIVRSIFNWFQLRNEHYVSPVVKGMKRNGGKTARGRILNDDEIKALWRAADECGTFGALCKVALLTAQRREKVTSLRWSDIDSDGVWTIPTDTREKGNVGVVQLPSMVLDIINAQPRLAANPFIFPAARGTKPFNNFADSKAMLDSKLPKNMPAWTVHDLRRTARSLLSRCGVLPHVSEQVLGHKLQGVEGIYDRHSYAHEKADALQRLAALVDRILNPPTGNVVTMARKA